MRDSCHYDLPSIFALSLTTVGRFLFLICTHISAFIIVAATVSLHTLGCGMMTNDLGGKVVVIPTRNRIAYCHLDGG